MATIVEEYYVETQPFVSFVETVTGMTAAEPRRELLVERLRTAFTELLQADGWLPDEFARPSSATGMGGGVGSYLLCRRGAEFSVSALVVAGGVATPVHDHLAWGLVGLYRGEQEEEIFRRLDDGRTQGKVTLELVERRQLRPGDFYTLLPPDGDIHRVRTTSRQPSISIHLLGNDVGCVWRHTYDPEAGAVKEFRSGYVNVQCKD